MRWLVLHLLPSCMPSSKRAQPGYYLPQRFLPAEEEKYSSLLPVELQNELFPSVGGNVEKDWNGSPLLIFFEVELSLL